MKRLFPLLLALMVLPITALFPAGQTRAQGETLVHISPPKVTLQPGQSTTIEVWVDNVAELWAFDLKISFNQSLLEVTNLEPGGFLETTPGKFSILFASIDNGTIEFIMTQRRVTDDDPHPRNGDGVLIRFDVTARSQTGISPITVVNAELSDRNAGEIRCEVKHGAVQVAGDVPVYQVYLPLVLH